MASLTSFHPAAEMVAQLTDLVAAGAGDIETDGVPREDIRRFCTSALALASLLTTIVQNVIEDGRQE